ncbi:hypothetical protein K432DRAFT_147125 [Lepidopterella palustris CBS 459.81]|uniref:Uncharacterized protein n=1 Tax=Lepidopterella palustris CBS 459.81 TaxID=1314670 RepID=A0A8E2EHT3_9PEZI|nr:hypothetical protein K432DRAFT_147125 [Lepidopterella palustris CBS 459.81]
MDRAFSSLGSGSANIPWPQLWAPDRQHHLKLIYPKTTVPDWRLTKEDNSDGRYDWGSDPLRALGDCRSAASWRQHNDMGATAPLKKKKKVCATNDTWRGEMILRPCLHCKDCLRRSYFLVLPEAGAGNGTGLTALGQVNWAGVDVLQHHMVPRGALWGRVQSSSQSVGPHGRHGLHGLEGIQIDFRVVHWARHNGRGQFSNNGFEWERIDDEFHIQGGTIGETTCMAGSNSLRGVVSRKKPRYLKPLLRQIVKINEQSRPVT